MKTGREEADCNSPKNCSTSQPRCSQIPLSNRDRSIVSNLKIITLCSIHIVLSSRREVLAWHTLHGNIVLKVHKCTSYRTYLSYFLKPLFEATFTAIRY